MLSGVGGDEVFSGYPRHLAYRISRWLDLLPRPVRRALDRAATPVARPGSPGRLRGPRRNLWKFMRAAGMDKFDRYLSFCSYYTREELADVVAPGAVPAGYDPMAHHRSIIQHDCGGDEHARLLYVDAKTFLPCLNLTYTDKMAMAASVEVRVPLLDDELVDLTARIPSKLKLRGTKRKWVFKKSQEGLVPHDVIWRPKAGFGAPVRAWLEGELSGLVADMLSRETIERRGLVRHAAVQKMWEENARGEADYSLRLYAILGLELWCRTFLDREWTFDEPAHRPLAL
jgi:asparagine synthase (glutamine-hydrolysing)